MLGGMGTASNFFNQYGGYLFFGVLVIDVVLLVLVVTMQKKLKKIFRGGSMDLDEVVLTLQRLQDGSHRTEEDLDQRVAFLEEALPKDIRRVGLVRYNPFSDAGGDQSFALALLNDHRDGVVISSLYGREMNRIYAKPVEKGSSKYQLSDEERQAIERAFIANTK